MEVLKLVIFFIGTSVALAQEFSCSVENSQRVKCGFNFISEKACVERKCCFDNDSPEDIPQCYFSAETTPVLTQWTAWGACSKECGEGVQSRQRECKYNDGQPAPAELCNGQRVEEKQQCNVQSCTDGDSTADSKIDCVERYESICTERAKYCNESEPVRRLCPITCGLCGATEAPETTGGVCEDQLTTCDSAKQFCQGSIIEATLHKLCPDTCGTCPDVVQPEVTPAPPLEPLATKYPLGVCTDEYDECKRIVSLCEVPQLQRELTMYCRRTCGLCFTLPRATKMPSDELPTTTTIKSTTTTVELTTTTTTEAPAPTTIKSTTTKATAVDVTTKPAEEVTTTTTKKPAPACENKLSTCKHMTEDMCKGQEYLATKVCPLTCNRCPEESESRISANFEHVTDMDGLVATDDDKEDEEDVESSTIPAFVLELLKEAAKKGKEATTTVPPSTTTPTEPIATTTTRAAIETVLPTETAATSTTVVSTTTTTEVISTTPADPYHMCKNSIGCGHADVKRFCDEGIEYILATCPVTCGTAPEECKTGWFSEWSEWSECDVTCGKGTSVRSRECEKTPESKDSCVGDLTESKKCNTQKCPRSRWSWSWSWGRG